MILLAAIALQSAAVPPARAAAIEQAIFDLCPRILAGSLSLADARQLRQLGYRPVEGRAGEPRAMRGTGDGRIYLIFRPELEDWRCAALWGGPDSRAVLGVIAARARRRGYVVDGPGQVVGEMHSVRIERRSRGRNVTAELHTVPRRDFVFGRIDLAPHGVAVVGVEEN